MSKPGSQHGGLCIPFESENHVNVGPVLSLGRKRTSEDDKHLAVTCGDPQVPAQKSQLDVCLLILKMM